MSKLTRTNLGSQRFRVEQELGEQNLTLEDMQWVFTIGGTCICEFADPLVCEPKSVCGKDSAVTHRQAQSGERCESS